jgi:hypothetical protein
LTSYGRVAVIFLTTIGPAHHTYNIQFTKNNFNEIILFQNSPLQPLPMAWYLVSMDTPNRTRATPSEGVGQERFRLVWYKKIK